MTRLQGMLRKDEISPTLMSSYFAMFTRPLIEWFNFKVTVIQCSILLIVCDHKKASRSQISIALLNKSNLPIHRYLWY